MKKLPILVLIITIAIDMLGFGIIIPVLPIYADQLGASEFTIGLIEASFAAAQFLFTPFWGGLSDRIGRRPVILISIGIMVLSYLVLANATLIALVFLARIVSGIGAANLSAAQAFISDLVKPKERVKYFGYIGAAFGIGFIFGPPLGGYLKTNFGIEGLGYVAAGISTLNFLLAFFFLPESNKDKNPDSKLFKNPFTEIYRILPRPEIRSVLMIHFVFIMAFSMMQITASLLWAKEYQLNEQEIGIMFAYVGISTALIQGLFVGKLSNIFGERRLFVVGNLMMAAGLASLPFAPPGGFLILTIIALTLISFGNAFVTPIISSLLSQNAKKKEQGKILGLAQSVGALSRVFGPTLGGFLFGLTYFMPNIVAGALMLLTTFMAFQLVKNKMRPQEAS
ncbi:MFS transporter [Owenweeksia hongkongensis]|uniref:MFS transporter n=1 Tax=Owenweeksia hongkongensis TaxID=253245 RepID=UPI003A93C6EA